MHNYNITCRKIEIFLYVNQQKILLNLIQKKEGFLLTFRIWGNGTEFLDTFLPFPNIHKKIDDTSYLIAWLLEGYFLTKKNQKFLDDIIKRIVKTFEKWGVLRIEWVGWINIAKLNDNDIKHLNAYNLRDDIAPYLESLNKTNRNDYKALELLASATEYKESDDAFFDWLRFKVYDFVKENRKNALTIDYCQELATIGYDVMGHKKGISTPLAKAKSIYTWVIENYEPQKWDYIPKYKGNPEKEKELQMTRRERALSNAKKMYEETHKKIISLVTGMFANEYKKKDGSFNINKIAKDTNVSRPTVYKHLKDEGLI